MSTRSSRRFACVVAFATAAALTSGACHRAKRPNVRATVATLEVVRGAVSLGAYGDLDAIRGTARVSTDGIVRAGADGRAIIRLDSGAFALVDRNAELVVHLGGIEVRRGRVFVDGRHAGPTELETAHGHVTTEGAAVSIEVGSNRTVVHCAAGEVTYRSPRGSDRFVQGEKLTLGSGEPRVEPETLFEDWTGGLATPSRLLGGSPSYVGAIDARIQSAVGSVGEPMSLRSHEVVARIVDDAASFDIVQTFFNGESETVVGEYRVRLPDGASIESFEIDRGSGYERSVVVPLRDAEALRDSPGGSARLVYDGPGTYRARISSIGPGQTLRVRVLATSWLERRGGVRSLSIPLAGDSEPPLIGELSIRVDASRSGASYVAAGYGASVAGKVVSYRASDTRPRADFVVELADRRPIETARVYQGTRTRERGRTERFARFDVPTDRLVDELPSGAPPLELLVVLDSSGGTEPEDLELARATLETLLAQLTPTDRLAVRLGDVSLHDVEGAPRVPSTLDATARSRLLDAAARVRTGGATDLGTVLREAAASLAGRANAAVLYLGDAIPTDGAMSATGIARELELVDDPPRLFAIGLGDDANRGLLRAIFGDSSVVVAGRDEAARRVLAILADAGRPVLRDVTVELGPTLEQAFPMGSRVVPVGSSTAIVARLSGELPSSIRVRARLGTERLDRVFPVEVRNDVASDDVPRRWASHRLRQLLDEDAGREALVELGLGFDLVTPWTVRVVGGDGRADVPPWLGVDVDPFGVAWSVGGATRAFTVEELGGVRGFRAYGDGPIVASSEIESTWTAYDATASVVAGAGADGGLGRASAMRVLRMGSVGPRGCFERKLLQRPDLSGEVAVRVSIDGTGHVTSSDVSRSTLGVADVDRCVLDEVRGLAFPATGGAVVTVEYVYVFMFPTRSVTTSSRCSLAAERDLDTRRRLWSERIRNASESGVSRVESARNLYRDAQTACEVADWQSRRALTTALLAFLPDLTSKLELYRGFADDAVLAPYLREAILRSLREPNEVGVARRELGLDPSLDFGVFARAFASATTPTAKLALVRRWLEVAPDDIDLRLRLLALLEETHALPEARRVAHDLHMDPLVDARARTLVGEFWLRQNDRGEAVRVLSELVERAPLDPWARRRLGDLYLTYAFLDDAQREYATLALLRPDDSTNFLLLARAAAAASRLDEALRLEQRVSEEVDDDVDEGLGAVARAFTTVRLARLRAEQQDPAIRTILDDRLRATGVLRRPPAVVVSLVWDHPDDRLVLEWLGPAAAQNEPWASSTTSSPELGISSFRILEREAGEYRVRVARPDARDLRESHATLVVTEGLGTANERTTMHAITLTRDTRERTIAIGTGT